MAAPVSPAVAILMKLGIPESTAKKNVSEGKINLYSVRGNVTDTSVVALAEHCQLLTVMNLYGCSNITDTSKQLLRDYLFTKELFGLWTRDESDCCVVVDDDMNACKGEIN